MHEKLNTKNHGDELKIKLTKLIEKPLIGGNDNLSYCMGCIL